MKLAGVTEIYRLGGVYGVAALACGTETIAKVEKIVGPGNAYVDVYKRQHPEVAFLTAETTKIIFRNQAVRQRGDFAPLERNPRPMVFSSGSCRF